MEENYIMFIIWENFNMIKLIFIVIFIKLILLRNKIIIFYYNLCFFIRFMMIIFYMFKEERIWCGISINYGLEFYSIWLIILRIWIIGLIFMSVKVIKIFNRFIFLVMLMTIIIFFLSMDIILFYMYFEIRLIPTFIIIVYWGRNFERVRASYYLLIYILLISFPLLIYIFNMYEFRLRLKFSLLKSVIDLGKMEFGVWGYLIIFIAFFIKIPIYLFHVWLPKAHVEAPVYGSMILAGILLKIGRYGLIRFLEILVRLGAKYNYIIFSVGIIGGLLVRIICLVQIDLKRLVAYSSVVHINIILCSLITLNKIGFIRRYIIMISHGLCSSGLFYIVNLYYERSGRRLLILNKGMIGKLPSLTIWWFFLCVVNFSFPFCMRFFREILMLRVLLNWNFYIIIYLIIICFLRRAYSLNLFAYIQHGRRGVNETKFYINVIKEFVVLLVHSYPLVLFIFNILVYLYLNSLKKILICGIKDILIYILGYS